MFRDLEPLEFRRLSQPPYKTTYAGFWWTGAVVLEIMRGNSRLS